MVMVPLYAISSLISLFSLGAAFVIDAIRDIYEVRPVKLIFYVFDFEETLSGNQKKNIDLVLCCCLHFQTYSILYPHVSFFKLILCILPRLL